MKINEYKPLPQSLLNNLKKFEEFINNLTPKGFPSESEVDLIDGFYEGYLQVYDVVIDNNGTSYTFRNSVGNKGRMKIPVKVIVENKIAYTTPIERTNEQNSFANVDSVNGMGAVSFPENPGSQDSFQDAACGSVDIPIDLTNPLNIRTAKKRKKKKIIKTFESFLKENYPYDYEDDTDYSKDPIFLEENDKFFLTDFAKDELNKLKFLYDSDFTQDYSVKPYEWILFKESLSRSQLDTIRTTLYKIK